MLKEPRLASSGDGARPTRDLQLGAHGGDVFRGGVAGDGESGGDLLVGPARRNEP